MKLLYDTSTQLFKPYTNRLGEEIVGLDPIYRVYELAQSDPPSAVPEGHHLEATEEINHETRTIKRGWNVVENTPLPVPEAERYKVKGFLIRSGIPLESIPGRIASVTAEGPEREEALMRWFEVPTFPKEHPLVTAVAAALNLDLDQVWDSILAIE
ncbi:hypothetical protein [Prosthecobacter sp.]|jgi:hypothetical protein|uniref:hypothetical protein n=1 Tax=Prosthecobacter sp. TaxID=1965333 RepID=UPI0037CCB752